MERSEIEKTVKSYIEQDLGGQEIENPKCDFKAKWYDLNKSIIKTVPLRASSLGGTQQQIHSLRQSADVVRKLN